MSSFEIPNGPTTIKLAGGSAKAPATASATFTVTNKSDQALTGRLKAAPQGNTLADWLTVQGEKERPFAASETQQITVNIAVPPGVNPGDYIFRLQAININNPGNDFAESAFATVTVPQPGKPTTPIWLYVLIAVALLAVVGGVIWFLTRQPDKSDANNTTNATNAATNGTTDNMVPVPTNLIGTAALSVGSQLSNFRNGGFISKADLPPASAAQNGLIASLTVNGQTYTSASDTGATAPQNALITVGVHTPCTWNAALNICMRPIRYEIWDRVAVKQMQFSTH